MKYSFMAPAVDVAKAGDLERAFGKGRRRGEAERGFELALGIALDLVCLRVEFGGLVQGFLIGRN